MRRGQCDAGFEPADAAQVVAAALLPVLQVHRQRGPDFGARGKLKVGRHHADHGVELVVQLHGLAEDVAAAGETPLPEFMAQDDDPVLSDLAFPAR